MNRSLSFAFLLSFAASLIHLGFFQSANDVPLLHVPILFVALYIFLGKKTEAIIAALVAGFILDVFSTHFFGLWTLTFYVSAAILDLIINSFFSQKSKNVIFICITVVTFGIFLLDFSITGINSLVNDSKNLFFLSLSQMFSILFSSLLTGLAGVLLMLRVSARPNFHIKPYIVHRS